MEQHEMQELYNEVLALQARHDDGYAPPNREANASRRSGRKACST